MRISYLKNVFWKAWYQAAFDDFLWLTFKGHLGYPEAANCLFCLPVAHNWEELETWGCFQFIVFFSSRYITWFATSSARVTLWLWLGVKFWPWPFKVKFHVYLCFKALLSRLRNTMESNLSRQLFVSRVICKKAKHVYVDLTSTSTALTTDVT